MTFAEKIVRLRKVKGLTQDEFASAVGVSRQAVYKWEAGQSYPEVAKLMEIKLLFNISIDDLLDENYEVALPEKKKRKRLSKETKREIEVKVEVEEGVMPEADIPSFKEETYTEEVSYTEPEKEEITVTKETVAKSEETYEETVSEPVYIEKHVKEETVIEKEIKEEPKEEKKKGFFGRLFGRK